MLKTLFAAFVVLLIPYSVHAESLSGVVRNVNYESHSFGLDVPPLTRVYINSGTKFKVVGAPDQFRSVKVGDKVQVDGRSSGAGVVIAQQVQVLDNVSENNDSKNNEIKANLDQRFLMCVSQTALVQKDGQTKLKIHSEEFINTLCKEGYNCSGEGEVGMRLSVDVGGNKNEILLTSKEHRKPTHPVKVQLNGYEIQLVEAGEDVVQLVVRDAKSS